MSKQINSTNVKKYGIPINTNDDTGTPFLLPFFLAFIALIIFTVLNIKGK